MLGKIMKHEFIFIKRIYFPVFIGTVGVTLFSIILYKLNTFFVSKDLPILSLATGIINGLMMSLLVLVPALSVLFVIMMFYRTMVGREGYLTHTLPIKKRDLVIGKNLSGMIFCLFTMVVSLICFILYCYLTDIKLYSEIFGFHQVFHHLSEFFKNPTVQEHLLEILLAILLVFAAFLVQIYFNIGYGYLCISLGQLMNKHKIIYTILFWIAINIGISTLSSILISMISILLLGTNFNEPLIDFISKNSFYAFDLLAFAMLAINAVLAFLCNFFSIRLLTNKLNLE